MSLSFTPHLGMNSGSFNSRRILIELFESTFHQQRYLEASAALSRLYTEKPNEDVLGRIRKTLVNYLEKHPENFNAVEELLRLILSNDDEPGGAGIHPDWTQLSDETFQKAYEVHYDALTKKGVSEEAIAARIKLNLGIFLSYRTFAKEKAACMIAKLNVFNPHDRFFPPAGGPTLLMFAKRLSTN